MMKRPDYGNWIPKTLMALLWSVTAILLLLEALCWRFLQSRLPAILLGAVCTFFAASSLYMQICRRAFSFAGGGVMGDIHKELLAHLSFNGEGTLLDIGCGSGALAIRCAKAFPKAQVTGIDYWGREWGYAKGQCEENARIEQTPPIHFQQGDAAHLPFADGAFDAAVSNFVFHEVRSEPDKRKVVREALRVVKKGGAFAFHDLFEQRQIYGDMEEFVATLRAEGIAQIHYIPHTEQLDCIPGYVKAPWLLSGLGMLYGVR